MVNKEIALLLYVREFQNGKIPVFELERGLYLLYETAPEFWNQFYDLRDKDFLHEEINPISQIKFISLTEKGSKHLNSHLIKMNENSFSDYRKLMPVYDLQYRVKLLEEGFSFFVLTLFFGWMVSINLSKPDLNFGFLFLVTLFLGTLFYLSFLRILSVIVLRGFENLSKRTQKWVEWFNRNRNTVVTIVSVGVPSIGFLGFFYALAHFGILTWETAFSVILGAVAIPVWNWVKNALSETMKAK